ncbi:MAG: hypothetical protein BJ554DRAFT_6886 [Olpidium bornovanus]|uniref:Uncharacterized protein n=1 Tax=Olpidium bornovanus TaxID=278681 RepID=A0A8H7ZX52_9FUNG|nr:MAG: hypothetical protein BJ554DRAFT_6886 [Olpidium bornovanus]
MYRPLLLIVRAPTNRGGPKYVTPGVPPLLINTRNLRRTHHHPQQSGESEDKLPPSPPRVVLSSPVAPPTPSHPPLQRLPPVDRPPSLAFDPRMPSPRRHRRRSSGTPAPDPGMSAAEPPSTALPLAALSTAPSMAPLSTAPATTALAPAVSSGEVDALAAAAAIPLPADEPMLDLPPRTVVGRLLTPTGLWQAGTGSNGLFYACGLP